MRRRIASGLMLALFSVCLLASAFYVKPARADAAVYIRADGSVDPPTEPLERNGSLYVQTAKIGTRNHGNGLVVERNDITIDCKGQTIEGAYAAVVISGRRNVTIKNARFKCDGPQVDPAHASCYGIILDNSSNCTVARSNSSSYGMGGGIRLDGGSSNNSITGNTVFRIQIQNSWQNYITRNKAHEVILYNSSKDSICENNITAADFEYVYLQLQGSSNNIISGNKITHEVNQLSGRGIEIEIATYFVETGPDTVQGKLIYSSNNNISANDIVNNGCGIYLYGTSGNRFYHNNMVNNTKQVEAHSVSKNVWDDGRPSGGNYWSNYNGTDMDGDGLGDTTYSINADNIDRYPLMNPFVAGSTVPSVSVLSPENKTYDATSVPLTFAISEKASWVCYSLDGQDYVTSNENTTLTGLAEGSHSMVVYAYDMARNVGASKLVYFEVSTPKPPLAIIGFAVVGVLTGGGVLLVCLRKIKRAKKTQEETKRS
jgi:parallel beta-helix repeat protein